MDERADAEFQVCLQDESDEEGEVELVEAKEEQLINQAGVLAALITLKCPLEGMCKDSHCKPSQQE